MQVHIDIQREVAALPKDEEITRWLKQTLAFENQADSEVTIRFVSEEESAALNKQYRSKQGPTNVLSFPFEMPAEVKDEIELNLLGDLVICSDVVSREAQQQEKLELAHWAHMIVHGTLHLLGYDHLTSEEAGIMENKEIQILSQLGYSNPYRETEV